MRIQSSGRSMQMMPSYQDVDNDICLDFVNEISEEMADEVAKTSNDLEPGESKDYSFLLDSQIALGLQKRDMFLTVRATDEISDQFLNEQQRDVRQSTIDLAISSYNHCMGIRD